MSLGEEGDKTLLCAAWSYRFLWHYKKPLCRTVRTCGRCPENGACLRGRMCGFRMRFRTSYVLFPDVSVTEEMRNQGVDVLEKHLSVMKDKFAV